MTERVDIVADGLVVAVHYTPHDSDGPVGRQPFKIPSLVGVGTRRPLMHDGWAPTLDDRLAGSAACSRGDAHGRDLDAAAMDALAARVESL